MKFTISQSSLDKALKIVSKGMGTHTTLPILSGIYIRAANGAIEMQTTDASISVRHFVAANVEEPGETVISGKVLQNIVKALSDAAVTFEGDIHLVTISSDKTTFKLKALSPKDFPAFPEVVPERTVELPSDVLSNMVDKVYRAASKETTRPLLQGILATVENNTVRLVATDSYRLAVCESTVDVPTKEAFEAIIPGVVFHDVLTMVAPNESISIGISHNQVVFTFGTTTFVTRLIEGHYPAYQQLLPASCASTVEVDTAVFSSAFNRVSVIAQQNTSVRFDVDADGGVIRLSANANDQGESLEEVPASINGKSLTFALNYRYVSDCLTAVSGFENLRIELQDSNKPCIFKCSNEKVNYTYLLMPVRL